MKKESKTGDKMSWGFKEDGEYTYSYYLLAKGFWRIGVGELIGNLIFQRKYTHTQTKAGHMR